MIIWTEACMRDIHPISVRDWAQDKHKPRWDFHHQEAAKVYGLCRLESVRAARKVYGEAPQELKKYFLLWKCRHRLYTANIEGMFQEEKAVAMPHRGLHFPLPPTPEAVCYNKRHRWISKLDFNKIRQGSKPIDFRAKLSSNGPIIAGTWLIFFFFR